MGLIMRRRGSEPILLGTKPAPRSDASRFSPEFIEQRGVRVLRLEYAGLAPDELPEAFQRAGEVIAAEPAGSLRILTLLDSPFDGIAAEAFKRYSAANQHFVRASAVVAKGFWRVVVTSVKLHGRRDLVVFDTQEAALGWLLRS
jgi:hypothetical protein